MKETWVKLYRGHSAVCAMAIPFTFWTRMHFTVEQVGRSTKSHQHTHRAPTACALRIALPLILQTRPVAVVRSLDQEVPLVPQSQVFCAGRYANPIKA